MAHAEAAPAPPPPRNIRLKYRRPQLYPKQRDAIFDTKRYSAIEASTKSGKTSGCIAWIIEQAMLGHDGWNYWWVAPVSGQADIAFRRACRALDKRFYQANISLKTITLVGGQILWFKSADKPDSLYGEDVYAAVIDEASRVKEAAWYAVRTTLTATRGPIRLIGNVKGRRNWFYMIARRGEAGDPEIGYHKMTANDAIDAHVLDRAEVDDARRVLPERVFRELYMAEPSDDEGNPFGYAAIKSNVVPDLSPDRAEWWGWDFAKSVDYTVGIGLDRARRVARFERFQLPWEETIKRVMEATDGAPALCDSTGVGDPIVERLQRQGGQNFEGYNFSSRSKQQLMEGLAVAIQSHNVTYPDGTIVVELEQFEYNYTATGVRYSAPEGFHDDCVMALSLACMHAARAPAALRITEAMVEQIKRMGPMRRR